MDSQDPRTEHQQHVVESLAADRSDAPLQPDQQGNVVFGPSAYMLLGAVFCSPFSWVALATIAFRYSAEVRLILWKALFFSPLQQQLVQFYVWMKDQTIPLWGILVGVGIVHALIRYSTTSFSRGSDGNLVVNTGLLGLRTPRGPFIEYENTVAAALISDVDVTRNLLQLIFRTGTLVVTFSELHGGSAIGRTVRLPYVAQPEKAREILMAGAGVHRARVIL